MINIEPTDEILFMLSPSCLCWWRRLPGPAVWLLLIAMEFLPQQVIAVMIIRDRHIERTPRILFPLLGHVHIDLTQFGVLDGKLGIGVPLLSRISRLV